MASGESPRTRQTSTPTATRAEHLHDFTTPSSPLQCS